MNFIEQKAEYSPHGLGLDSLTRHVALCSGVVSHWEGAERTTAESTVARLVRNGDKVDIAALKQGTVYLEIPVWKFWAWRKYVKHSKATVVFARFLMYVTVDYASVTNDRRFLKDLQRYLTPDNQPTDFHKVRKTVLWTVSKATLTRFKEIFNPNIFSIISEDAKQRSFDQLLFVAPIWFASSNVEYDRNDIPVQKIGSADPSQEFARACFETEMHYKSLKVKGVSTMQLADTLPGTIAEPAIVTATEDAWRLACLTVAKASPKEVSSELKDLMRKTEKALKL